MENSANLALPYIMPSQAQKHVTHNEALELLDALVQCAVADRDMSAPPAAPVEGERHIVAEGGIDAWQGQDGRIALWRDGGWRFFAPGRGWVAFVIDEQALVHWSGSGWEKVQAELPPLQNLALLGVGTTANAANPFAAKLNKALWTALAAAEGGDGNLRCTLNKEGPANVVALLMQSNWNGRAEIGLAGDDDLTIKVSADGATWKEALRVDRHSGAVALPHSKILRDALINLLPDAGRFAAGKGLPAETFAFPAYFIRPNGTTVTSIGKFIHDNTDYGGSAGTLAAEVKELVDKIRHPARRRYGPEYHVAQLVMGAGTSLPYPMGSDQFYMSIYFDQRPRLPSQTFHYYLRALDAPVQVIREGSEQVYLVDGVPRPPGYFTISPADGWVSITVQDATVPYASSGYIPRPFMLAARSAGDRYLLACPALMPGIVDVDDNVGMVPGFSLWLP